MRGVRLRWTAGARPGGPDAGRRMLLGWGMLAAALGLAVNSVLGPFVTDTVDYPLSPTLINQTVGLEAVSLVVVVPILAGAGVLTLRGSSAGLPLALGPALFVVYMMVQYVAGPQYLVFPAVVLLQLALFMVAGAVLIGAWGSVDPATLPHWSPRTARLVGALLVVLAGFVLGRYLPVMAEAGSGELLPAEYLDEPSMFWTIFLMDVGIFVPAAVVVAAALLRHSLAGWVRTAAFALLGWFALVGIAVAAMAISMRLDDDPNITDAQTAVFVVVAALSTALAVLIFRPLLLAARGDRV